MRRHTQTPDILLFAANKFGDPMMRDDEMMKMKLPEMYAIYGVELTYL